MCESYVFNMLGPFPPLALLLGWGVVLCFVFGSCVAYVFGVLVWSHGFRMSDCWFVLWVGCVKATL